MKTAVKILNIVGVILDLIVVVVLMCLSCTVNNYLKAEGMPTLGPALWLIPLFTTIIASAICLLVNYKLERAVSRRELIGVGILNLVFANLISGILMLCMNDEDLNN